MKPVEKLGVTPGKWHLEVFGEDFAEIWSGHESKEANKIGE